jgi:hypothetical protein
MLLPVPIGFTGRFMRPGVRVRKLRVRQRRDDARRGNTAALLIRDGRAVASIETAFVLPVFLLLILSIVQLGIYFMMQSALDSGVLSTAATLRANIAIGSSYVPPTGSSLKASIVAKGAGMLTSSIVTTDLRQLVNLTSASVPIADGTTDWGGSGSILVLRAHATMNWYLPSAISVAVDSMAIVRRPNY